MAVVGTGVAIVGVVATVVQIGTEVAKMSYNYYKAKNSSDKLKPLAAFVGVANGNGGRPELSEEYRDRLFEQHVVERESKLGKTQELARRLHDARVIGKVEAEKAVQPANERSAGVSRSINMTPSISGTKSRDAGSGLEM